MLKEIKLRYEANCHKCQRTLQAGWKAYYQAEPKKVVFCKSCGEKINKEEAEKPEESTQEIKPDDSMLDTLFNTVVDMATKLDSMDRMLSLIQTNILDTQKLVEKLSKVKSKTK